MRYLFILSGVVCLAFMLLPACAPQPEQQAEPVAEDVPSTEADVEAIKNVARDEVAAGNAGDLESFLAILSDDIEIIPYGQPAVRGEQARQWIREFMDQATIQITYTNEEIVLDGDLGVHRYSFEWTVTPKGGGDSIHERGAGIHVMKRQSDGSWKIAVDIWNPDAPTPQ
jgi:ketosteroid isomerase-like protein